MIDAKIFTKFDNGSYSSWEVWKATDTILDGHLYSSAEMYVRIKKMVDGTWQIRYCLVSEGITLPKFLGKNYNTARQVKVAVKEFARWALENRRGLIAAHERY